MLALEVTATYLVLVLAVIYFDYSSEVARGAYTDTFHPLGFARTAAWPGSYLGPISIYPDGPFNAVAYKAELQPSLRACLWAALVQASPVYVACLVTTRWRRRRIAA